MSLGCRRSRKAGFTLIELMIVVSIIGILATIALPKFADLVRKSQEGATKGNMGSFRSAINIYYNDLEGQYTSDPSVMTVNGKYLASIPFCQLPYYHSATTTIIFMGSVAPGDNGAWAYVNNTTDPNFGFVWLLCAHTDSKGTLWSTY